MSRIISFSNGDYDVDYDVPEMPATDTTRIDPIKHTSQQGK